MHTMDEKQSTRFNKIHYEEFYLLDHSLPTTLVGSKTNIANIAYAFKISGSTRTVYSVQVYKNGTFFCDCMDMKLHCKKTGCVCKHVCFVYTKVLKMEDNSFYTYNKCTLDSVQLQTVIEKCDNLNIFLDACLVNMSLKDKYDVLKTIGDFNVAKPAEQDDECPICYNCLASSDDRIHGCPTCKNNVHFKCISKWLIHNDTCVYCRSDVWKFFDKKSDYIQL